MTHVNIKLPQHQLSSVAVLEKLSRARAPPAAAPFSGAREDAAPLRAACRRAASVDDGEARAQARPAGCPSGVPESGQSDAFRDAARARPGPTSGRPDARAASLKADKARLSGTRLGRGPGSQGGISGCVAGADLRGRGGVGDASSRPPFAIHGSRGQFSGGPSGDRSQTTAF